MIGLLIQRSTIRLCVKGCSYWKSCWSCEFLPVVIATNILMCQSPKFVCRRTILYVVCLLFLFLCFKLMPKLYISTIVTDSHDPDPFWVWTMDCQYYEKIKIVMSMIWEDQKRKTVVLAFIILLFYYFIILLCFVYLTYLGNVMCWGYDMCSGTAFGSLLAVAGPGSCYVPKIHDVTLNRIVALF